MEEREAINLMPEKEEEVLQVTSLSDIKREAEGELVKLKGWSNKPFVARLKRCSMMGLVSKGVIPNSLMAVADELFNGKSKNSKTSMTDSAKILKIIATEVLAEPRMEDLDKMDVQLTDEQLLELFQYSQRGLKGLQSFRKEQADYANHQRLKLLQTTTQPDNGDKK